MIDRIKPHIDITHGQTGGKGLEVADLWEQKSFDVKGDRELNCLGAKGWILLHFRCAENSNENQLKAF